MEGINREGINKRCMGYAIVEVMTMAKKGMKRLDGTHTQSRNDAPPVPEIHGKARHGKMKVRPIIPGAAGPEQKVFHAPSFVEKSSSSVLDAYAVMDNDLAKDNLENDLSSADRQDL